MNFTIFFGPQIIMHVWIVCGSVVDHYWINENIMWILCGSVVVQRIFCVDPVRICSGSANFFVWISKKFVWIIMLIRADQC